MTVRSHPVYVLGVAAFLCLATNSAVAQAPSWNLTGNSGIDANRDFLGTTDSQPLIIKTQDTERLRVESNGNVGIGGVSPGARFTVLGDFIIAKAEFAGGTGFAFVLDQGTFDQGAGAVGFQKRGTSTPGNMGLGNGASEVVATSGNLGIYTFTPQGGYVAIGTNGTEALRIDLNGNVGIGTISPQVSLEINSGFDKDALRFSRSAVDYHSISTSFHGNLPSHNFLGFNVENSTNNIQRVLTLQGDGNVGIGVKNPGMALDVQGRSRVRDGIGGSAAGTAGLWFNTENSFGQGGIADIGFVGAVDATRIGFFGNDPRGGSGWGLTFDTVTGNVGIGTQTQFPQHKLQVNGDASVQVLTITGADVAEPFPIANDATVQPGMVVAIDPAHPGQLRLSDHSYDHTVAGVVAGANDIGPGIILASGPGRTAEHSRPVALSGRAYVWADATDTPIRPGDLITTSDMPGYAMKVTDHTRAPGAVLGKAMSSLPSGTGLVLVLVCLQ